MSWKPIHQAHAIESLRLLVNFSTPIADKILSKVGGDFDPRADNLGFDARERAQSAIGQIPMNIGNMPAVVQQLSAPTKTNGWIFKRTQDTKTLEEVGFRDLRFGYVTAQYGRWASVESRYWDVMEGALSNALAVSNVESIRIEYWDRFLFDGNPTDARADALICNLDGIFPPSVGNGSSMWHLHRGWFDDAPENSYLINVNIDATDVVTPENETRRSVSIYNYVEFRANGIDLDVQSTKSIISDLHRRSMRTFSALIQKDIAAAIGLDSKGYN